MRVDVPLSTLTVVDCTAVADASPLLGTCRFGSNVLTLDLKLDPSSVINKFCPVIPVKLTLAPFGVAANTADVLPLSSPILLVMILPGCKLRIASFSVIKLPETSADVRVPIVVVIWYENSFLIELFILLCRI